MSGASETRALEVRAVGLELLHEQRSNRRLGLRAVEEGVPGGESRQAMVGQLAYPFRLRRAPADR